MRIAPILAFFLAIGAFSPAEAQYVLDQRQQQLRIQELKLQQSQQQLMIQQQYQQQQLQEQQIELLRLQEEQRDLERRGRAAGGQLPRNRAVP